MADVHTAVDRCRGAGRRFVYPWGRGLGNPLLIRQRRSTEICGTTQVIEDDFALVGLED
jgi:hypothetical protein